MSHGHARWFYILVLGILATACGAKKDPSSLLLVTIDTLRADRVGAYGAVLGVTPNIDALAQGGWVLEHAVSPVPLTLPAHSTILSGLDPLHHGVRNNGTYVFPTGRDTLATLLKSRGYATGAFVSAAVLDRRFGLARGFDAYDDQISRYVDGRNVLESERPCAVTVEKAAEWMRVQKRPFFIWVHMYEPHAPYLLPADPSRAPSMDAYSAEVRTADGCLGTLLTEAKKTAGESLVTGVTSDHGEGLGDHGELTHGLFLYQSTLSVPMVIAGSGVTPRKRSSSLARSADLAPTLLALLGVPAPSALDGRDLNRGLGAGEAYAETDYPTGFGWASLRSWRINGLKYIDAPKPELFDLDSDPNEERNLLTERAQDAGRLKGVLRAAQATEVTTAPQQINAETEERLRALGYVAGKAPSADPNHQGLDPKDAAPLLRRFEQAMNEDTSGDLVASSRTLADLVKAEPANITFRRSLASAFRRSGRAKEAVNVLRKAQMLAPRDATIAHDLAVALADAGMRVQAIESERVATTLDPKFIDAFSHLATLEAAEGAFAAARASVDQALTLDPNNARAWSNRGNIARAQGDIAQAERSYKRALDAAPDSAEALNGLGVLAVEQGRLQDSSVLLEKALAIDPSFHEARLNLAVVTAQIGDVDKGASLAKIVEAKSSDPALRRKAAAFLQSLQTATREPVRAR